ncbi:MAG: hypothetical protein Q4P78_00570 [Rothia sp. (in: high G+C Gram-positive bacteria)]|uniref:hypothetical protein n=1 Tax=Rothia sp. (in: high G+C Gram-positive bacteria) TaxID=1885016 RepID=UPI0026DF6EDC|nr:hypothetical protein [Rothia sp. (in: high G+C Gram-positive bacteria)]MDO5749683.1 hypothetical protein [Rothia sp. (in: high G+C Gram-positive bacteria)]
MVKNKTFLGCVGVIVLALSACSAPSGVSHDASPESFQIADMGSIHKADAVDHQAVEKVNDIVLPPELVTKALQKSAGSCMVSRGHVQRDWYYMPRSESVRDIVVPVPLSIEAARDTGYNSLKSMRAGEREKEYAFSDAEAKDYYGYEGGNSCQGQAWDKVFGDKELSALYFQTAKYMLPYVNAAITSEEAVAIDNEWSTCMKDKGYDYSSPSKAIVSVANKPESQEVAIADATCRDQVRFEERTEEILDAYMTTFLNDNQALLERVAQAKKNAEANAPNILDGTAS